MSKSPGHQKWPDHKVQEKHVEQRVQVELNGEIIADSDDVIKVEEDGNPDRYYFPRSDVKMNIFERSQSTTECPFKGTAHYFSLKMDGKRLDDVVWTYEEPYDEHLGLKDRLAFYEEKAPQIHVILAA